MNPRAEESNSMNNGDNCRATLGTINTSSTATNILIHSHSTTHQPLHNTITTTTTTTATNASLNLTTVNSTTSTSSTTNNNNNSTNVLCKVRAQVMTRDDSTGGWVPINGGGLSTVIILKKRKLNGDGDEFVIIGRRIQDQKVVLFCGIQPDLIYHKVMPTFHHWFTANAKFGLTFVTATEAKLFDQAVKTCCQDLLLDADMEQDEEDIFMALDLPAVGRETAEEGGNGSSNSSSSNFSSKEDKQQTHLHRMSFTQTTHREPKQIETSDSSYVQFSCSQEKDIKLKGKDVKKDEEREKAAMNEYSYPSVILGEFISEKKKVDQASNMAQPKPLLPRKKKCMGWKRSKRKQAPVSSPSSPSSSSASFSSSSTVVYQCKHCLQHFNPFSQNKNSLACRLNTGPTRRGVVSPSSSSASASGCSSKNGEIERVEPSGDEETDCCLTCIQALTCVCCASCVLYHCCEDDDDSGDPQQFVNEDFVCCCVCFEGRPRRRRKRRCLTLFLLSLFLPCLLCFPPLRFAHGRLSACCCPFSRTKTRTGTHEPL